MLKSTTTTTENKSNNNEGAPITPTEAPTEAMPVTPGHNMPVTPGHKKTASAFRRQHVNQGITRVITLDTAGATS
jgi:hypothetical protein